MQLSLMQISQILTPSSVTSNSSLVHCRFNLKLPSWAAVSSKDFLEHILTRRYTSSLAAASSLCSSSSAREFIAPPGLMKPKLADFKAQSKSHLFTQTWNTTG